MNSPGKKQTSTEQGYPQEDLDQVALHDAQVLIERHPERWIGYERGARILLRLAKPEEAKAIAERGLLRCAEPLHLLCVAADASLAVGDHDAALTYASKLMHDHPDRVHGYESIVKTLIHVKDYDQARRAVELGLRRFPNQFKLLCAGDDACHAAGDRPAALDYARRLTDHHPERRTGYLRSARHLVSLGKHPEALSVLRKGLTMLPHDFDLLRAGDEVARSSGRSLDSAEWVGALIEHHSEKLRQCIPSIKALGRHGNLDDSLAMVVEPDQEWQASCDRLRIAHLLCRAAGERERALRFAQLLIRRDRHDPGGYVLAAQDYFGLKQFSHSLEVIQLGIAATGSNHQLVRLLFEHQAYSTFKQFCDQHEFPWDARVDSFYAGDELQVVHWIQPAVTRVSDACPAEPAINSVSIQSYGRFSNLLIQLTNALFFAAKTGLKHIYLPENPTVRSLFPKQRSVACNGYDVNIVIGEPPADQITLLSTFYFVRQHQRSFYAQAPSMRELVTAFSASTGILGSRADPAEPDDPGQLCIHLRSGDIFRNSSPPQSYGQPPLAFYTLAIRHFRPASVILVYEDTLNPVIQGLQSFLSGEGIPFTIHSSLNVRDDIRRLIRARALVIGRGSFARGVLCFSEQLETLYTFCEETSVSVHQNLRQILPAGTRCFNVIDGAGTYASSILNGWRNTPSQRDLMCSFPETRLALEEI